MVKSISDKNCFSKKLEEIRSIYQSIDENKKEESNIARSLNKANVYQQTYDAELKLLTEEYDTANPCPKEPKNSIWLGWLGNLRRVNKYVKKVDKHIAARDEAIKGFKLKANEKATEKANLVNQENQAIRKQISVIENQRNKLEQDVADLFNELEIPKEYQDISYVEQLLKFLENDDRALTDILKDAYYSFLPEEEKMALEAEKRFAELIKSDPVDIDAVNKAALEGSPSAKIYMARELFNRYINVSDSGTMTKREIKDVYTKAQDLARELMLAGNDEAAILYICIQVLSCNAYGGIAESLSGKNSDDSKTLTPTERLYFAYKERLDRIRKIKESGKYPIYNDVLDTVIPILVKCIDGTEDDLHNEKIAKTTKPKVILKNEYCRFYDHGVCRYHPNTYHVVHCEYVNNPGKCSIALGEKAVVYEFE